MNETPEKSSMKIKKLAKLEHKRTAKTKISL